MIEKSKIQNNLNQETLNALINGDVLVIHVKEYLHRNACKKISDNVLSTYSNYVQNYVMAPDLDLQRIGMSLFETECKEERLDKYFNEAKSTEELISAISYPYKNPIAQVVGELDMIWPHGLKRQKRNGKELNSGLCRVLGEDEEFLPHQDVLDRDVDWEDLVNDFQNQIALNLYVKPSVSGGQLEIWDCAPALEEVDKYRTGTHNFYHRDLLPPEPIIIDLNEGDLALFCSTKVHAVRKGKGKRMTLSNFIGYYGEHRPLKYWA